MDVDFLPIYVIVLKILGIVILIVGSVTLYLIATHSAKNGKQYKYALFVHQFLLLFSHAFLCLCYVPIVVPPYIAIYPAGFLKDVCSSIVLLIFQLSVFLAGVSSVAPLFHFRLLAVLPYNHFLRRSYIFYPLMALYYIPAAVVSPITLPSAYWEQDKIKEYLFKTSGVNDIRLFDRQTVALTLTSTGLVVWTALIAFAASFFTITSTTAAVWTLTTLNNLNTNLSQKTRIIQRKLTISLIIQTVLYNLFFVGISLSILILVMSGYGYTAVISVLFWMYSSAFILHSVLLVVTNDRYKQAALDVFAGRSQRIDSLQIK